MINLTMDDSDTTAVAGQPRVSSTASATSAPVNVVRVKDTIRTNSGRINNNRGTLDTHDEDHHTVTSEHSAGTNPSFTFLYDSSSKAPSPPPASNIDKSIAAYEDDDEDEFSSGTKLMVLMACVLFIFNFIGISINLVLSDNDSTSRTSKNANMIRQFAPNIAADEQDLNQICSSESISTLDGFGECKDRCEVVKCCLLQPDHEESCANADMCSHIQTLCQPVSHAFISNGDAKTGNEVDDLCTNEILEDEIGRESCYEACEPAECCFESGENSCLNIETEEWCRMFSSCGRIFYAN